MLGALIGAGLNLVGGIAGNISQRNARKRQMRELAERERENQVWFERKYNEDPLKRANTQRLLTQMNQQIRERNDAAKGRQAVMGGTEDSVTATKEANAKAIADTTSDIVAANDARKDAVENEYMRRKDAIRDARANVRANDAANTASVVSSVASTAGDIANALDSTKPKPKA